MEGVLQFIEGREKRESWKEGMVGRLVMGLCCWVCFGVTGAPLPEPTEPCEGRWRRRFKAASEGCVRTVGEAAGVWAFVGACAGDRVAQEYEHDTEECLQAASIEG